MKKLYMLAVAALTALSMNAGTIYLVGGGTVDGNSLPGSPNGKCVAVTSENNVYTFTVKNVGWLKISDKNASNWADFNKNGFTIEGKGDYAIKASELGQTFKLWYSNGSSEGTNNINPPSTDEYVYTLTVGAKGTSNSTLVVTAKSGDVVIPPAEFYLRGSWNSYGTGLPEYKFQQVEGDQYEIKNVTLKKGVTFKVADNNWGSINYGNGQSVNANTEYKLSYNGDDMTLNQDITNATIKFNLDTEIMYIDDPTAENPGQPETNYSSWWVNLGGEFNGNNFFDDGVQPVDKIATFTNQAIGNKGFKIKTYHDNNDYYYISETGGDVATDTWVQFAEDGYDINVKIANAPADGVYTVKYNVETNQIYIEQTDGGNDQPETPKFGIVGSMQDWAIANPTAMTESETNTWTYTYPTLAKDSKFKIAVMGATDWEDAVTYGSTDLENVTDVVLGQAMGASTNKAAKDWNITEDLTNATITFKYVADGTSTVTVTGTTSGPVDPETPEFPDELYLLGDINGWDPSNGDYKLNNDGDGFFSIEDVTLNNSGDGYSYLAFISKLGSDNEDWSVNSYRYGAIEANNNKEGTEAAYIVSGFENGEVETEFQKGEISWAVPAAIYTITVSFEDELVVFEKTADIPDVPIDPEGPKYGVVGTEDMQASGEWTIETAKEMTADGNVWTVSYASIAEGSMFKIADMNSTAENKWDDAYGAEGEYGNDDPIDVTLASPMNAWKSSSNNWKITQALTDATITFTIPTEGQPTVTVTGTVEETPEGPAFGIVGSMQTPQNWNVANPIAMTAGENNTWTYTFETLDEGAEFKIAQMGATGWEDAVTYGSTDLVNTTDVVLGNVMDASVDKAAKNWKITETLTNATVTFTYVPDGTSTLVVSTPEGPDLYLVGESFGWNAPNEYKMEQKGNVYTITVDAISGQWKIKDGADNWDYNFGAGKEQPIANKDCDVWFAGESANFTFNSDKPVKITLTVVPGSNVSGSSIPSKLYIDTTVGVEGIEAEFDANAPVEYYNLQGVRVANPENGIYIMRQGSKVTKIMK